MSVSCINTKHPEFEFLKRQTELPDDYLCAVISAWMEDNDTDRIPTAEELSLEIKNANAVTDNSELENPNELPGVVVSKLENNISEFQPDRLFREVWEFEYNKDYILNDYDFDGTYEQRKEMFDNRLAPNGKKSKLFETIMSIVGNESLAKKLWMRFYTPEFRQWFGDWVSQAENQSSGLNQDAVSKIVDENGEPLILFDAKTNESLQGYTNQDGGMFSSMEMRQDARIFTTKFPKDVSTTESISAFVLSVKDPLIRDENEISDANIQSHVDAINQTEKEGVIIRTEDSDDVYVAFNLQQIRNAYGKQDTQGETVYFQITPENKEARNLELDRKVERFLEKIGVSIHSVNKIKDKYGNTLSATAKADMLNKIIEVVNDRAGIDTLPEEAAHFFVEMLGDKHPLYQRMYRRITDMQVYKTTVEQYKNLRSYRNEDGTLNIDKLKKEAIGKAIARHIIEGYQTDSPSNLNFIEKVWEEMLQLIRYVFRNVTDNPFMDAAQQILTADTSSLQMDIEGVLSEEEYFSQENPLSKLIDDQSKITIDNTIDLLTKEKRHTYFKDGEPARGSVTSFYVEPWLRRIFGELDTRDDVRRLIDTAKADYGDLIHMQIQELFRSWTKPDGTRRSTQDQAQQILPGGIYKTLNNYVQDIMNQFDDPGTVFMSEVKIFDSKKKIGGTIDLLVVEPDGNTSVYDWKSQEIYRNQDDIKPYKEKMYRIQLEEYVKILRKEYGFKEITTVRAIPIRTKFTYKNKELYSLESIEIGDINPANIPDEKNYLLPVVLMQEPTGDEQLDNLITQLNAQMQKLEKDRYSYKKDEVYKKKEEITRLRLAIRDLQLRGRIDKMVVLGMAEYKKYKNKLEKKELSGKEIRYAIRMLEVFSRSSVMLHDLREEQLEELKNNKKDNKEAIREFENTNKKFLSMTANIAKLIEDIKKYQMAMVEEKANEFGIKDIADAEAELGFLPRNFQALSNLNRKLFRTFSRVLNLAQQRRDSRTRDAVNKLGDIKTDFVKWAKSKNMSVVQAMEMMLNIDEKGNWNGKFLTRYEKEFYKQRAEAVKTGDAGWILNNTVFNQEAYEESLERTRKMFEEIRYEYDEAANEAVIKEKIQNWISNHNIYTEDGKINVKALMNVEDNRFLRPHEKWETQKWKTLFQMDTSGNYLNKPIVDAYNYFQGLLKYSRTLGMIDDDISRQFIPSMYASSMENIAFGDLSGVMDMNAMAKLEVDSGYQYTPEVDPQSGEVINRIPVYYTKDMGVKREDGTWDYSRKSRDLFKVFGIWAGHMYNYEAMSDIEDTSLALVDAERNKESLVTDNFGNIVIENNRVKKASSNQTNAALLEEFVNFYLYDKQSGNIKDIKFRNRVSEKISKVMGKPPKDTPKEYSLTKTVQTGVNYFGIKTLALNLVSSLAQLVGGGGNVVFQGLKGNIFTTKTWGQAVHAVFSSKKARAALGFMDITEGTGREGMFNSLSLVAGDRVVNKHNAFFLQRMADKSVTQPVVIAMMMEHMLDDNKQVVHIPTYVKQKYNYNDTFYNLSESERNDVQKKIDEEVKTLKETKSLLAIGKTDEKGNFSIEGLSKEDESFLLFKQKILGTLKRIIGNTGRDDLNNVRTGLFGSAAMQFRSWIPEMIEDRFDGLKYDDELQTWTYGRYNLFVRELFSKGFPGLIKGVFNGFGGVDVIARAKEKYQDIRNEYRLQDKDLDMTEAEFIDMYIGTMRSMVGEIVMCIGIVLSLLALTGGDDDEKKTGMRKLMIRSFKKFQNEFLFYMNPAEFRNILSNPLPFLGLSQDFGNFIGATSKEMFGDEESKKEAKPMKYFYKLFPVGKEALIIISAFDDDFRKEYDIRLDNYFYR